MKDTLTQLIEIAEVTESVLALGVCGSQVTGQADSWSDLDLILVIDDGAMEDFYPSTSWLTPLGTIFTSSQSKNNFTLTSRIVFDDLRRLDLVLISRSALEHIDQWPSVVFWQGIDILFSRSDTISIILSAFYSKPEFQVFSAEAFAHLENDFWFKAMLAISKVVRDDRLIAFHLSLDLVRDVCVLMMILRDNAEEASHHRTGGVGNDYLDALFQIERPTAEGILDIIEQSAHQFINLSQQLFPNNHPQGNPLFEAIRQARQHLL